MVSIQCACERTPSVCAQSFKRVSVYYPRGVRTGGPEALHQLVDGLRRLGHDASLVPIPGTENAERVSEYAEYNAPEVSVAADGPHDAIVFPEIWLEPRQPRGSAKRFCWWLSIDNSKLFAADRMWATRRLTRPTHTAKSLIRAKYLEMGNRWLVRPRVRRMTHLAQSRYARDFLVERLDAKPTMLSDYILVTAPKRPRRPSDHQTISFNATKGGVHVSRLRDFLPSTIEWIAIERMSHAEVQGVLERSDIYLDLGHQPGKDRLPREAALLGAVSVIAMAGAGANSFDWPLPRDHKVHVRGDIARNAAQVITNVLTDVPLHFERQASFRDGLTREKRTFERELRNVFGDVRQPTR